MNDYRPSAKKIEYGQTFAAGEKGPFGKSDIHTLDMGWEGGNGWPLVCVIQKAMWSTDVKEGSTATHRCTISMSY